MKNGLALSLVIILGLYSLSYLGLRSESFCTGWWWKASYFNNCGIWPGQPLYWIAALINLGIIAIRFFLNSSGRSASLGKEYGIFCPYCESSLEQQEKDCGKNFDK